MELTFIKMNKEGTVFKALKLGPSPNHAAIVVGEFIPATCVVAYNNRQMVIL